MTPLNKSLEKISLAQKNSPPEKSCSSTILVNSVFNSSPKAIEASSAVLGHSPYSPKDFDSLNAADLSYSSSPGPSTSGSAAFYNPEDSASPGKINISNSSSSKYLPPKITDYSSYAAEDLLSPSKAPPHRSSSSSNRKRPMEESPAAKNTPEQLGKIRSIIEDRSLTKPLSKDSKEIVENSAQIISKGKTAGLITTPEVKQYQSTLRGRCSSTKQGTPFSENQKALNTYNSSKTARDLEYGLGENIPRNENRPNFLNIAHLTTLQHNGGLHYIPEGDPRLDQIQHLKTSQSGVISGCWVKDSQKSKHSSFFPTSIRGEKELLHTIQSAEETPYQSATSPHLFLFKDKKRGVYIEKFRDPANQAITKSAYPVFGVIPYSDLTSKSSIPITQADAQNPSGISKTPAEINTAVNQSTNDWIQNGSLGSPFSYTNPETNTGLIDIAPHLGIGVPKGILVEIPIQKTDSSK